MYERRKGPHEKYSNRVVTKYILCGSIRTCISNDWEKDFKRFFSLHILLLKSYPNCGPPLLRES